MVKQGVVPRLIFLLKVIGLICNSVLPYSEGLPQQLPDTIFPSDQRRCQQQGGGRNCLFGVGNPRLSQQQEGQPSSTGQACRGDSRVATQQRLFLTGGFSADNGCHLLQGNVLWPDDASKCARLFSQEPCPRGQWVILSNNIDGTSSRCAPRPCVGSDKVLMNDQCYHVNDNSMCPPTMTLQTNEFGFGECDCPPGTIYHQRSDRCYRPYSRGPCQQGFIIKVVDLGDRRTTQCLKNPCPDQNMAPLDQQCLVARENASPSQCHRIDGSSPCSNGNLIIDGVTAEPGCSDRAIFTADAMPCRRGQRKDLAGRCRMSFDRRPVNLLRPQAQGQNQRCRNNQVSLGGRCITQG